MSTAVDLAPLRRDRENRRAPRSRLDPFPRSALSRWMLRLGLAAPLLLIASLLGGGAYPDDSPNADLAATLGTIDWSSGDAEWLALLYPHVTILIAASNPFGRMGLSVLGAIAAGFLLQKVAEIIAQRAIPRSTGTILIIALAANPLFAYFALENLPGFLALTFFGLAVADLVRFVNWGNTESGFRAGILLMVSALCDPSGVLFALVAVMISPFLRQGRSSASGRRAANLLVIAFPTVAAFATLAWLQTMLTGSPWPTDVFSEAIARVPEGLAAVVALYQTPTGWLIAAPVVSAWLVAVIVRRPATILLSTIVLIMLTAASVLGALHPGAAGVTFTLMTLLAITLIPGARTVLTNVLVDVVAVLQIAIAWLAAVDDPTVRAWMQGVAEAAAALFG